MIKLYTRLLLLLLPTAAISQPGQWTWIHGTNGINSTGNYGTKSVPAPTNEPPNLYQSMNWTDLQGNFWLFGGAGNPFGTHSDLWKYNPKTNEWAWFSGPGYAVTSDPGNYGAQ